MKKNGERPAPRTPRTVRSLQTENAELRLRLGEAEETLRAIREGEVDAVIVSGSQGDRVFSLTESQTMHRLMVETMSGVGLAATPDGTIVYSNTSFYALLRLRPEDTLGHSIFQFVNEKYAGELRSLLLRARKGTAAARLQFHACDGAPVSMHVSASVLDRPEGPLVCFVGTDLSAIEADRELIQQLKEQREQTQADAVAKTQLLNEVNHRVKNNLIMILGLILTERRRAAKDDNAGIDAMWANFECRIQGLLKVHQMLSDSHWAPINIGQLAEQICSLVIKGNSTEPRRSAGYHVEHSDVYVSARQAANIAVVFNELITNSLKHAFVNIEHPMIRIKSFIQENRLRIEFKDNGPGFPQDVLEEKRLDVGLRLIRRLVEQSLDGEMLFMNQNGAVVLMFIGIDEKS